MGQRYIRSVSTSGGLSIPVTVAEQLACNTDYATRSYTYATSAHVDVLVENNPAECQFYNGTSWITGDTPLPVGWSSFPSNHQGIRLRNRDAAAPVASITVQRYTT